MLPLVLRPRDVWQLLRDSGAAFMADGALSRGAAISFYATTSLGPVLLIVVAIAGLAFGEEAAQGAITGQFGALMGKDSAVLVQSALASAADKSSGIIATLLGTIILLVTASGVFGEMQDALNVIWKAETRAFTMSRLVRARAASIGLVASLGFLLLISLVVSAGLSALSSYVTARFPIFLWSLQVLDFFISFALVSVLFAAIYKVLPDVDLSWGDVVFGAVITSVLFNLGKYLIGLYLTQTAVASSYGASGAVVVVLLWVYYSTQIFLFGAELTKAYASRRGTPAAVEAVAATPT